MPHEVNLITTIAAGLGLAMVLGFIAARLKLPPLVGYLLAGILIGPNTRFTIAEQNRDVVERLREEGAHAVSGDASDPAVLIQAHVARAAMLVIATPDTIGVRKMIDVARKLNPKIQIVLRTHSDEEATMFRQEHAGEVFMGEHELAKAMTHHVLSKMRGS